jgi:hypothetical protein
LNPASVVGGGAVQVTVTLSPSPSSAETVALLTSNTQASSVPANDRRWLFECHIHGLDERGVRIRQRDDYGHI